MGIKFINILFLLSLKINQEIDYLRYSVSYKCARINAELWKLGIYKVNLFEILEEKKNENSNITK